MKPAPKLVVLVLVWGLTCASVAEAGNDRPIVAVFDVELKNLRLPRSELEALSDYLTGKIAGTGFYQVVSRDQLKKRLRRQKVKIKKDVWCDQSCQFEIGKELAAEKMLSTKVLKLGSKCTVSTTLYDLGKGTADSAASVSGKCKVDDIVASMDKAIDDLTGASRRAVDKKAEEERKAREAEEARKAEEERKAREEELERKAAEDKARRERLAKSKDVKQPGTNLYWLRCPIGQRWTGSSCEGDAREMTWHDVGNACPSGYRLPTRQEFVSLLGGCDAKVRGRKWGYCNNCKKSGNCSSMFGRDLRYYWSSSSYAADSSLAWCVYFTSGDVDSADKANDANVRCVRSGP